MQATLWEQRGIHARDAGRHAEAEGHFARAVQQAPDRPISWLGLALSQIDQQRVSEAIASLYRARDLSPQSGVVNHLLDSLNGRTSKRAPENYVVWLFNTYAADFDNHLARLAYQGPDMLRQLAVRAGWHEDRSRAILDLGCGTGLSGLPFVPHASRLDGIDLSPGMLNQARRRGIYDDLHHGEAHAVLGTIPKAAYDVVIAADTLIYIGDVTELFRLVAASLKPGGSFLFTVETGEHGFTLAKSGRYNQADAYLRDCARGLFDCTDSIDGTIRVEAGQFTPARAYRLTRT
ncbi:MAG: methyltransferase domain-containing protein [Ferrovibrio sp.]|uniref:class I SAM-dependent DNA methyltransferase n=1 Tax=Ferrovibrio sp. TaxID=1917215 RepID=UPI002628BAB3|nr:methyltransferase domain-containing protein [Ferrovibrio sp.]MCW0232001.1 methyltransferase domain-containing protein [Ferrovibrio sp.]